MLKTVTILKNFSVFSTFKFLKSLSKMSKIAAAIGLTAVVIGYGGRFLLNRLPKDPKFIALNSEMFSTSKYYRGGFESKMTRREAALILGVAPTASKQKIKEAHKRIMVLNHPDKGGSPYVAAKINEARDLLDK